MKRLGAFIIDMFLIIAVSNVISYFLPNYDRINELSVETSEVMVEYIEALSNGDDEKLENYDNIIDDYNYESSKISAINKIILVVLYFIYFVLFQTYNNGQTLGKRIFKIRVIDNDNKKLSMRQMFIRSSIIYPIIFNLIVLLFLLISSENVYLNISSMITLLRYTLFIICGFMVIFTSRGLHDIVGHTKVVLDSEENDDNSEGMADKWKNNNEKEHIIKKYHHTAGKIKK